VTTIMRNQIILIIITISTLALSGFLFYSGLRAEVDENFFPTGVSSPSAFVVSPAPVSEEPEEVLGEESEATPSTQTSTEAVAVTKVIDGDTIEVEIGGEKYKLRFIGINTPETVDPRRKVECFGKEASAENKRLLSGAEVVLEKDVSETDKFGRLLRYVYLKLDDGSLLFVNDYLVRQGYAYSSEYPPDIKYSGRLNQAQTEAREAGRGLWSRCQT
jgi:micrococcal nuclease